MNWKNRLTNYNFWVSMVSAVLLIFQAFNLKFDIIYINEIATAVLGLLVVIGIVSDPTRTTVKATTTETKKEVKAEIKQVEKTDEKPVEGNNVEVKEEAIPVEIKNENNTIFNQDDFKVLIEKISADLQSLTAQKSNVENVEKQNVVEKIEDVVKAETTEITAPKIETINYNIVN